MTAFQLSDIVQSHVTAQGMTTGSVYLIVGVHDRPLHWGGRLVTYVVMDDRGNRFDVVNLHILAHKVADTTQTPIPVQWMEYLSR